MEKQVVDFQYAWGEIPVYAYPALCFSFLSRIPSLETSLLNTRMPITMLTC